MLQVKRFSFFQPIARTYKVYFMTPFALFDKGFICLVSHLYIHLQLQRFWST